MKQLPLFPKSPRTPAKPVDKRKPSKSDSWTRLGTRTSKCDDCLHALGLAEGRTPVARMAAWKYRTGGDGEIHMLCHAHKQQRVDHIERRGKGHA